MDPSHKGSNPNRNEIWNKGKKSRVEQIMGGLRPIEVCLERPHKGGASGKASKELVRSLQKVPCIGLTSRLGAKVVASFGAYCLPLCFLFFLQLWNR